LTLILELLSLRDCTAQIFLCAVNFSISAVMVTASDLSHYEEPIKNIMRFAEASTLDDFTRPLGSPATEPFR